MSSGATPLAAWGGALLAVAALGRLGFGLDVGPSALLAVAGLACVLTGLAAGAAERRRPRARIAGRRESTPQASPATTTLALGVVVLLVGVGAIGQAITALGVVLVLVGGYGVGRERWEGHRRLRADDRSRGARSR